MNQQFSRKRKSTKSGSPHTLIFALLGLTVIAGGACGGPKKSPGSAETQPVDKGKILYYRNPMNPKITSPVFKKDEMGMDYIPVYENEVQKP